jgi:hypothetical protein
VVAIVIDEHITHAVIVAFAFDYRFAFADAEPYGDVEHDGVTFAHLQRDWKRQPDAYVKCQCYCHTNTLVFWLTELDELTVAIVEHLVYALRHSHTFTESVADVDAEPDRDIKCCSHALTDSVCIANRESDPYVVTFWHTIVIGQWHT